MRDHRVTGGHRSADKILACVRRLCQWKRMRADVAQWVNICATCWRFRAFLQKVPAEPSAPTHMGCWQEVAVDFEGPSSPEKAGNRSRVQEQRDGEMCRYPRHRPKLRGALEACRAGPGGREAQRSSGTSWDLCERHHGVLSRRSERTDALRGMRGLQRSRTSRICPAGHRTEVVYECAFGTGAPRRSSQ